MSESISNEKQMAKRILTQQQDTDEDGFKKRGVVFNVPLQEQSDLCIPRGDQSHEARQYTNYDDFEFQIVDWHCDDEFKPGWEEQLAEEGEDDEEENYASRNKELSDPREYAIRVFGVTESGHSVSCKIMNYEPSFFVKVPLGWTQDKCEEFVKENITHKKSRRKRFDKQTQEMYFAQEYKARNYRVNHPETGEPVWCSFAKSLVEWKVVKRHDFNAGFTGTPAKKFKFIELTFSTLGAFKQCYWALRKQKRQLNIDIYEANLDPQLRFMHIKEILAAGWINLPKKLYRIIHDDAFRDTSLQLEVEVHWDNVEPVNRDDVAPVRQLSFDIECYSHEHDKFPIPEDPKNPVFQIGSVIQDYGNPDKYIKHLITLKKCDPIPGTIVVCCETEEELLIKFQELLYKSDPDIIYGYNIFGFDLNYLMVRAKLLGCDKFTYLGRMKYQQSAIEDKSLSSAAYGDNKFKMVPMPGRLQIDLLQVILRGMTKYPSYTLGYISQEILCSKLKDDPLYFTKGSKTLYVKHAGHKFKPGTVVHLFSMFPAGGFEYEEINKMHIITDVVYKDNNPEGPTEGYYIEMWKPATVTEWGGGDDMPRAFETKFDLPAPEIFAKFASGSPADIKQIGEYCVQDCMLPQKIINKCNILMDTLEMAKVTYVPTSFLITRGQQIKVFSQFCKKCREEGYLVHTVESVPVTKKNAKDVEKYQGATVLPPEAGAYWDCITCLDFKALYPTTEIDWNLCYTTLVKDPKYANLPGVKYLKKTVGKNTYLFAQSHKGIVPQVLEHLLNARGAAKQQMAEAKTPFMKDVYNSKQLALKVSCNSVYGFTGCGDTGMLPCKPIAETTTTIGRGMISDSKEFEENRNNFEEIVDCVDWFPVEYYYLSNFPNGKHGLLTTDKVLKFYGLTPEELQQKERIVLTSEQIEKKPLKVWTTEEFQQITSFDAKPDKFRKKDGTVVDRWLYKVSTEKGEMLNMKNYSCKTVYGDSIPWYTPVIYRYNDISTSQCDTVEYIGNVVAKNTGWTEYKGFKVTEEGLWDKEYVDMTGQNIYVRTNTSVQEKDGSYVGKWTKLRKVIRHKTNKDIYRVTTHKGIVDVTADHSLISDTLKLVTPKDLSISEKLCHIKFDADIYLNEKETEIYSNLITIPFKEMKEHCPNSWMVNYARDYLLLRQSGHDLYIEKDRIHINESRKCNLFGNEIINIEKIGSSNGEYVYDLETDEGTFNAGIGEIMCCNTDSVFSNFDTTHLESRVQKIAYSMIVGGYVADRITEYLRSLNPFKPYNEQWTELEYEKVYLELLLLTKKRYLGSLYEFNPYKRSYIDKKGVAMKRRDYCKFVHDVFKAVLKCIFDDNEPDIDVRIERAKKAVTQAVDDLLANKVPFEKLILSKLLKGRYKVRDQTKAKSFDETNIFVDDLVKWYDSRFGMCTGVVKEKRSYSMNKNDFFGQFDKPVKKRKRAEMKDLDVMLKETENELMPENDDDLLFRLSYDQLKAKCGYEITIEKIMDPKTPEKELEKVTQAHARLARRMYKRDPGSAPSSGVRLQFMFVQSKNPKAKQYEKSEHPDYVREHNLKPDPIYYLEHQLKTPMMQLFALLMDDPESLFRDSMNKYRLDQVGQRTITSFFGKK